MTLQKYLLGIAVSTVFCLAAFVLVLLYVDPSESGIAGFLGFYASLGFGLVGLFTLIGFYIRLWSTKNEVIYAHVAPSFRQAVFLAILVIGCLILQSFRLLTWWDGLLFAISVILLEVFFMSRMKHRSYLGR